MSGRLIAEEPRRWNAHPANQVLDFPCAGRRSWPGGYWHLSLSEQCRRENHSDSRAGSRRTLNLSSTLSTLAIVKAERDEEDGNGWVLPIGTRW